MKPYLLIVILLSLSLAVSSVKSEVIKPNYCDNIKDFSTEQIHNSQYNVQHKFKSISRIKAVNTTDLSIKINIVKMAYDYEIQKSENLKDKKIKEFTKLINGMCIKNLSKVN